MKKLTATIALAALAMMSAEAVTLNVKVPAGTRHCYVAGVFNSWDANGAVEMSKSGTNTFTLNLPDVTTAKMCEGFKYLCGQGWAYVEKGANGEEISNRTSVGNPDVVGSWASMNSESDGVESATIAGVNGYDRKVQVYLPKGYGTSGKSYPVIYYVGVQQRYSQAGSDTNRGDDFFAPISWDVARYLDETAVEKDAIVVATYSFVAENIPYAHSDFMGSGASQAYLNDFTGKVMKYVDTHYRTLTGAANTSIIGADLGGLLSLYATLTLPERFGRCVSVSPLLRLNADQLGALASTYTGNADILLTYGTGEPASIGSNVNAFASSLPAGVGHVAAITGGIHRDDSWRDAFPVFYAFLTGTSTPSVTINAAPSARAPRTAADIASTDYTLYSKIASSEPSSLDVDNTASFRLVDNYRTKDGDDVRAKVLIRVIDASVKSKFYWNVKRATGGDWLQSSMKNVSFSSKKSADSWLRVVINADESVDNIAACSTAFRVVTSTGSTVMSLDGGYIVKADVEFGGSDKNFAINFGSVNSGSDMGAVTGNYSVGKNCTKAHIVYDFESNRVTVTETDWGDTIDNVVFATFQAIPAATYAGGSSQIYIRLSEELTYNASLTAANNYGTAVNVPLTSTGKNAWQGSLSNLKSGIYHLSLTLSRGTAVKKDIAVICIRVNSNTSPIEQQSVTVNAYKDVDWNNTGRYKANFHTHTSQSFDTQLRTDDVVDRYHAAGYKILALTDHDANPYPWDYFDLFNPEAQARYAEDLGMLAIPGVELSKDNRNTWDEATGGQFNHHNDFFTGRKGMEFASLRESYAYTQKLGGMQIINHPGQYWSLDTEYTPGDKNSAKWHADNFNTYSSLVGLEVYNQGNRRPNDRILWDQILAMTMPSRPVWGYSCDDSHNPDQHFRNYQFMLMPSLTVADLKTAMRGGVQYFSYEYTGSGKNLAPTIDRIVVDPVARTITVETDATDVRWISGTDRNGAPSTRRSSVVGMGRTFSYDGFESNYVRAIIYNEKGETCTQPFGFGVAVSGTETVAAAAETVEVRDGVIAVDTPDTILAIDVYNVAGRLVAASPINNISTTGFAPGVYIVNVTTDRGAFAAKVAIR